MRIGLYPGTFDPVSNGHIDVINKGSKLFDKLYVCILKNPNKQELFTLSQRIEMLKLATSSYDNVEIISYDGMTVDACKLYNASYIIRGLRDSKDFKYEFDLASIYKAQDPSIEVVYVMASNEFKTISSSKIRELINFSNDSYKEMVPKEVFNFIKNILKKDEK